MKRLTYKDRTLPRFTEHGEFIRAYSDYDPRTIINKLSEYEDLEEQGRLVVLPCKTGDTVYDIYHQDDPMKVKQICIEKGMVFIFAVGENHGGNYYTVGEFGKRIFRTRAEAEAALKGEHDGL